MERVLLEYISGHIDKKVIRNSQHGFTKSNLTACYAEMTGSVDGERAGDIIHPGFMLKGKAVIMGETKGCSKGQIQILMKFNVDNCQVLHLGMKSLALGYALGMD
ncbi:hypothetical protein BTVI_125203 [Pitangus sulphuratus]|nr:hypothetical protein BTVI_125203 [Pitangus sulphuratus]